MNPGFGIIKIPGLVALPLLGLLVVLGISSCAPRLNSLDASFRLSGNQLSSDTSNTFGSENDQQVAIAPAMGALGPTAENSQLVLVNTSGPSPQAASSQRFILHGAIGNSQ